MADYTGFTYFYNATVVGSDVSISGEVEFLPSWTITSPDYPLLPGTSQISTPDFADGTYIGTIGGVGILVESSESPGTYYVLSESQLGTAESYPLDPTDYYCLLAGTLVATPVGERPVESLRPGDLVLTAAGEAVEVRWVGRQSRITMFAGRALPITIRAGALAVDVPSRDLNLSPDHAMLIDGYLVCAQALVNGTTVVPMPEPPAQLDYYHLELDRHRVILANGTPVESFVDDVSRRGFDNFAEWEALGLNPLPAGSIEYPRVKSARQPPAAIRERMVNANEGDRAPSTP
jgi:hypothetical protein